MKKLHRDERNLGGFELHVCARGSRRVRNGKPWLFLHNGSEPMDPHYRKTSRMAALPGKHLREVKDPARATHGKLP